MQIKIVSHLPAYFYNNNNNKKLMFLSELYNMLITKRKEKLNQVYKTNYSRKALLIFLFKNPLFLKFLEV